jgi:YHS domain-containing protein
MRFLTATLTTAAFLLLPVAGATAGEPTPTELQAAATAVGSVNGLCPVMKKLVTPKGGASTYKGEKVAFCCPGCKERFDLDPTRYMDRMRLNPPKYWYVTKTPSVLDMRKAKDLVGSANGRCPVMGKVVVPKAGSSTYEGHTIAFCCPPCKAKFEKDPEKYMRIMRADPLAYAYDRPGPTNTELRVAREAAGAANGLCPVEKALVNADAGAVEYGGETIAFSTADARAKFEKDPETYMRPMRDEPAIYGYLSSR